MVNRKSQLKKLKVNELKEVIKVNNLGSTTGKKNELIERIGNHERFKEIKSSIIIPQRTRAPPSDLQIKNRKNFQKMVFEKHNKIKIKTEGLGISIKEMPIHNIEIREITHQRPRPRTRERPRPRTRKRPPAFERPRTP